MEEIVQHWGDRLSFRNCKIYSEILLDGKIFFARDFCMQLLRWWRLHVLYHFPCYQRPCLDLRQRSGPSHRHESCIQIWCLASYFQCLYEGVWCASWHLDNLDQQYVHYTVTQSRWSSMKSSNSRTTNAVIPPPPPGYAAVNTASYGQLNKILC